MKLLKDISLFISAFVPMFVLILVKLVVDIINSNLTFNILNTINLITLIFLILTGAVALFYCKRNKESITKITILSAQNITDKHFLGYFSLFVLFALQLDLSLISEYCAFVLIMIFIAIVYIKNSLYYINPLLNLLGFNFYDVQYSKENDKTIYEAKIFYKGSLDTNQTYYANIKNKNWTFINKKQ